MKTKLPVITAFVLLAAAANGQGLQWAEPVTGSGIAKYGTNGTTDSQKNIYTVGNFTGTADLDPGTGTDNFTSAGGEDMYIQKLDSMGNYIWGARIGGTGNDNITAVTVAPNGNVVVCGSVYGSGDIDPGPGTATVGTVGTYGNAFVLQLSPAGAYISSVELSGTAEDLATDVTTDAYSNIYVTGTTRGTFDADPSGNTFNITSAGAEDAFVAKFTSSFAFLKAFRFGSGNPDVVNEIILDHNNDVLITGAYRGTVDFDPDVTVSNMICVSMEDIYVAKYDSSLSSLIWSRSMGGTGIDLGYGIVADTAGNCYITGNFRGTCDFDPGTGTQTLTTSNSSYSEIYMLKLDVNGNFVWVKHLYGGFAGQKRAYAIAIDENANIYIAGDFEGSMNLDPISGGNAVVASTGPDMFVASYTSAGLIRWGFRIGSAQYELAYSIWYASNGVFITGTYGSSAVDFDPTNGVFGLQSATNTNDGFTAKFYGTSPNLLGLNAAAETATGYVLFPNPFTDILHISGACETLTIRDYTGKIITAVTNQREIDLSGLAAGLYLAEISNNGVTTTQKILKK